jgi:hypothetical protein
MAINLWITKLRIKSITRLLHRSYEHINTYQQKEKKEAKKRKTLHHQTIFDVITVRRMGGTKNQLQHRYQNPKWLLEHSSPKVHFQIRHT